MKGISLDDLPAGYREQAERQIKGGASKACVAMALASIAESKPKEKRSQGRKLNATEARCKLALMVKYPTAIILSQALQLAFEDGTSYRPDFMVKFPHCEDEDPLLVEVKGGYKGPGWEQGTERYRRAKDVFGKWFGFEMWTWKSKEKRWEVS